MILRRVARPLLASAFVYGGVNVIRAPQGPAAAARPLLDSVLPVVDPNLLPSAEPRETARHAVSATNGNGVTESAVEEVSTTVVAPAPLPTVAGKPLDEVLVIVDGGVKVVAGTLLALGKAPRLASATLAASLIPTTLAGHAFWKETDPQARAQQKIQFAKNATMLGGLLIASADTAGKPSLGWRGRRAARAAGVAAEEFGGRVAGLADGVAESVGSLGSDLGDKAGSLAESVGSLGAKAGSLGAKKTGGASALTGLAAGLAGFAPSAAVSRARKAGADLSARTGDLTDDWAARAAQARKRAEKRGAKLQKQADKRREALRKKAEKKAAAWEKTVARKRKELDAKAPGIVESITTGAARIGYDVADKATTVGHDAAVTAEKAARTARKRLVSAR